MKKIISILATTAAVATLSLVAAAPSQAACTPVFSGTDTQGRVWNFGCKIEKPTTTATFSTNRTFSIAR